MGLVTSIEILLEENRCDGTVRVLCVCVCERVSEKQLPAISGTWFINVYAPPL